MLVSVDADRGTVTVFGTTVITVPINQINKLATLLRGRMVQYVSEVTEASGDEVLEMIKELAGSGTIHIAAPEEISDGRMWLHATGAGQLYLKLDKKLKLSFEGPMDFMSLDRLGYDICERFPQVESLRRAGKLEIVSTKQMNRIKKQAAERQQDKDDLKLMNPDGSSVLVDTGIKVVNGKAQFRSTSARAERGEVIDMEDYKQENGVSDVDMLPDEVKAAIRNGWGKPEEADEE